MKNTTKFHILFIVIFQIFWNPITFYFLYSNLEIYKSSTVKLLFWILPILSFVVIVLLLRKNKIIIKIQNSILGISFLGIFIGILILSNFFIGRFITPNEDVSGSNTIKERDLIFKSNSRASYKTIEFNFTAEINSIGLRNREISINKNKWTYRILCFGDSYTYGWGVNVEHSWPMQLEAYLLENGIKNIEIINCGRPGQYTSTYKKYMTKLVPLLKPNLVLLEILQIDDLAQIFENDYISYHDLITKKSNFHIDFTNKTKYLYKQFLKDSFGNYFKVFKKVRNDEFIEVSSTWLESSSNQIEKFGKLEKLRFLMLPDTIQTLFKTGNINPGILHYYIKFPDRIAIFNNPTHPATIFALNKMEKDIKEMKRICKESDIKMILINMPTEYFCGHEIGLFPSGLNRAYFTNNNNIDSLYSSIAKNNEMQYLQLTEKFIELKDKESVFFLYDDHPNKKGYEIIAKSIGEYLIDNKLLLNNY